jgi:hypothetical protein
VTSKESLLGEIGNNDILKRFIDHRSTEQSRADRNKRNNRKKYRNISQGKNTASEKAGVHNMRSTCDLMRGWHGAVLFIEKKCIFVSKIPKKGANRSFFQRRERVNSISILL